MPKKLTSLRPKSESELTALLAKLRGELLGLQGRRQISKLKDNQAGKKKKKEIAQILTLIKEKENLKES